MGEWTVALGGLAVLYSVFSTGRRGYQRVQGYRYQRKKKLARQHEAAGEYYGA